MREPVAYRNGTERNGDAGGAVGEHEPEPIAAGAGGSSSAVTDHTEGAGGTDDDPVSGASAGYVAAGEGGRTEGGAAGDGPGFGGSTDPAHAGGAEEGGADKALTLGQPGRQVAGITTLILICPGSRPPIAVHWWATRQWASAR
jgi:hypothetical protein